MNDWAIIILLWITLGGGVIIGFSLSIAMRYKNDERERENRRQLDLIAWREIVAGTAYDKLGGDRR